MITWGFAQLAFLPSTLEAADFLALLMGYILAVILGLLGLVIIGKAWKKDIDLSKLICDHEGKPSLARFQNLIFTVVIGMSFFWLVIKTTAFPAIPNGVWVLLGISVGTFLGAKTVETNKVIQLRAQDLRGQELEVRKLELELEIKKLELQR